MFRLFGGFFKGWWDETRASSAQRQFTGNAALEAAHAAYADAGRLELFSAEHPDARPGRRILSAFARADGANDSRLPKTLLEIGGLRSVPCTDRIELGPMAEEILADLVRRWRRKRAAYLRQRLSVIDRQRHAHHQAAVSSDRVPFATTARTGRCASP